MIDADLDDLRVAAVAYAARGWSVLPIGPDKRPALPTWKRHQTVRADERTIRRWFTPGGLRGPVLGVGIVLGDVSGGLAVRDFDEAGAYGRWASAHPELAATLPTAETARGHHVYGWMPEVRTVTLPGGELRAAGSYVVAPPSVHHSGVLYRWTVPLRDGPLPLVEPTAFGAGSTSSQHGAALALWPGHPEDHAHLEPLAHLVRHPDLDAFIGEAIAQTVPAGHGCRNDGIFRFVRRLKGHPELRGRTVVELRPIARRWFDAALPSIASLDFDTTWSDFGHAWERARTAFGDALGDAVRVAEAAPDPSCAAGYDDPRTRLLIRLSRELQSRAGDRPYFLAGDRAAQAVSLEPRQANRRLAMLVRDGVLELAAKGHTGRASEYWYRGD